MATDYDSPQNARLAKGVNAGCESDAARLARTSAGQILVRRRRSYLRSHALGGSSPVSNVIIANIETRLPLPAERILDGARDADLSEILLLGWMPDGQFYAAATHNDLGNHLILLEKAKAVLMQQLEDL